MLSMQHDGKTSHANARPTAGPGYVVVKGKAGLGNRMLSAATGIAYARMSGRIPVIDWSDPTYSDDGKNVFGRLFDVSGAVEDIPGDRSLSVAPSLWSSNLDRTANEMVDLHGRGQHSSHRVSIAQSFDLGVMNHAQDILVMWGYGHQIPRIRPHMTGPFARWRSLPDLDIVGEILRTEFSLRPDIKSRVEAFRTEYFRSPMLGLHVRFMDRRISLDDFLVHVDRCVERERPAGIFLATDNKQAEATIRARYPNVVSTAKWFPDGGISMHQNPDCPDRLQNAKDALLDMYLLAECEFLIFPGSSTFSLMSSLMSRAHSRNIIDVERYKPSVVMKRWIKRTLGIG